MSTPVVRIRIDATSKHRWLEIDWAMKALSLAMHHVARLGMTDVFESLQACHEVLKARRDRA
jgi:hypothetical protein